jgi:hypothetical protein
LTIARISPTANDGNASDAASKNGTDIFSMAISLFGYVARRLAAGA